MRAVIRRWRNLTPITHKISLAWYLTCLTAAIILTTKNPTSQAIIMTTLFGLFTMADTRAAYYSATWKKFYPLTTFGADIGDHLHAYGNLLIEQAGDQYHITPLTLNRNT